MNEEELISVSQGPLAYANPVSEAALLEAGRAAGLSPGMRVLDIGCGRAELLLLWAREYGISGCGIECRRDACYQAEEAVAEAGEEMNIRILCADIADISEISSIPPADCVVSLGASQCWGGAEEAITALAEYAGEDGVIVFGERCWKTASAPPEFARQWPEVRSGYEMVSIFREAGYDVSWVRHSTGPEWDAYESAIWENCRRWLEENPDHSGWESVHSYMQTIQDEYFAFARECFGWALFIARPALHFTD